MVTSYLQQNSAAPEPLHEYMIQRSTTPVHTNGNAARIEYTSKRFTSEATTLISIKYFRLSIDL